MSVLIVGGDKLGNITEKLMESGFIGTDIQEYVKEIL